VGPAPPRWLLHRYGKFPGVRELQQQTVHGPYPIEDKVQVRGGVPGGEGDAAGPARYPEGFCTAAQEGRPVAESRLPFSRPFRGIFPGERIKLLQRGDPGSWRGRDPEWVQEEECQQADL